MTSNRWLMLGALFLARTSLGFQFQTVATVAPLLVSDLLLPDGRGTDLAYELQDLSPGLRSIIVTGHTDGGIDWDEARRRSCPVLHKPLGMSELLEQVRLQLDD